MEKRKEGTWYLDQEGIRCYDCLKPVWVSENKKYVSHYCTPELTLQQRIENTVWRILLFPYQWLVVCMPILVLGIFIVAFQIPVLTMMSPGTIGLLLFLLVGGAMMRYLNK